MKYEKPEVVALSSAIDAIHCTQKDGGPSDKACTGEDTFSPGAYEADE
jgi:hypothetical protein